MDRTKLVALALIRAAMTNDEDTILLLLTENAGDGALLSQLLGLTVAILEEGLGEERALAALDGWMRRLLEATA